MTTAIPSNRSGPPLVPISSIASRETHAPLPAPLSSFIGRERELADIGELLRREEVRLVTLTGPGGVGKTRLAIRAAEELNADFPDGVWFVPLAPVRDPVLVVSAIAHAIGIQDVSQRSLTETIVRVLRGRNGLLLLDNFEHLLPAAPVVTELLAACPGLTCVITSRAVLRIVGEHAFPVPPLPLPPAARSTTAERAALSPAVQLFVARGRAARPEFALGDVNADDVERVCRYLDGMPLAIELAAARLRHLTVTEIVSRLITKRVGATLGVLAGGPRDVPQRQQTLRDTIAWSYALLAPEEQVTFRRLGVFVGGFTPEAAEAVANFDGDTRFDVGAAIWALADQSLLQREEGLAGASRYGMLETIREFALEQLETSGEARAAGAAHAAYFLTLAEQVEPELLTGNQAAWIARLATEHANFRSASAWFEQVGDAQRGLRLAGGLWRFWHRHGDWEEGRARLEAMLALPRANDPAVLSLRAEALTGAGWLALYQNDFEAAQALLEEGLACYRGLRRADGLVEVLLSRGLVARFVGENRHATELYQEALSLSRNLGDHARIAESLFHVSMTTRELGDYLRAAALCEEALVLHRAAGYRHGEAIALLGLGDVARDLGDARQVHDRCEASLAIFQGLGEPLGEAFSLHNLAAAAACGNRDLDRALNLCEESVAILRRLGGSGALAEVLTSLGLIQLARGDRSAALSSLSEALPLAVQVGPRWVVAAALEGVAQVASAQGHFLEATGLMARAAALRKEIGVPVRPNWEPDLERTLERSRNALGDAAFTTAWASGQGGSLDDAITVAMALEILPDALLALPQRREASSHPFGLSEREVEVLGLLVASKTDREIAETLFISSRTASKHVSSILAKLNVASRSEAALLAVRHGLRPVEA